MGRWLGWSSVFGCCECQFLTTMCHAGCGSRCRAGHSADCKETIGSSIHWHQLDALPAKSEGAAHLLPGNTLVSAPWKAPKKWTRIPLIALLFHYCGSVHQACPRVTDLFLFFFFFFCIYAHMLYHKKGSLCCGTVKNTYFLLCSWVQMTF